MLGDRVFVGGGEIFSASIVGGRCRGEKGRRVGILVVGGRCQRLRGRLLGQRLRAKILGGCILIAGDEISCVILLRMGREKPTLEHRTLRKCVVRARVDTL
jgi:hypothetical protein